LVEVSGAPKERGEEDSMNQPTASAWLQSMLCHCGGDPTTCIPDNATISHYGELRKGGACRHDNSPLQRHRAPALSAQVGRLSAAEMAAKIYGVRAPEALSRACVRYTTAGELRAAGFAVVHSAGRVRGPKGHCSIVHPPDAPLTKQGRPWPDPFPQAFDGCFNEEHVRHTKRKGR
jgi:hypothetical protein